MSAYEEVTAEFEKLAALERRRDVLRRLAASLPDHRCHACCEHDPGSDHSASGYAASH